MSFYFNKSLFFLLIIIGGIWVSPWGLMLAKQKLYPLSHLLGPFLILVIFFR
jgi:hypothetical protein